MVGNMVIFIICLTTLTGHAYPTSINEDYKVVDHDVSLHSLNERKNNNVVLQYATGPGAHQLASWIALQLRPKEFIPPIEVPVIPYRLPLQGKRNSEVTNAMMNSEETQKMYREGRK